MDNVVLKALSASNFAPFADKVEFTTQIDKNKKEFIENTFNIGDNTLNKVSFIYGANGSGKTFFCKILREIQRLLAWSPLTLGNNSPLLSLPMFKGLEGQIPTFTFDLAYSEQPTSFSVDILLDAVTYHYEFSIQGKKVLYELLTKKHRRTEILMERKSQKNKDILLKSEFKNFDSNKHTVKEEALCLAIANALNNPLAVKIVEAINSINILNMTAPRVQPADAKKSFSKERMEQYVDVLRKADPTLRSLEASVEEENIKHSVDSDDFENREIISTKTTVAIKTEHALYNDGVEDGRKSIDFFNDESLGTVKLFTVLPHLYDVLECGGVLILDEIENGLHLSLVRDIIRLFTDPVSNPHNSQLICTTHQPLLVDGSTRRDQVWIISKDTFGKSKINRLSEMSTSRAKVNLTNRLLEGAFGCNPESFFQ